MEAGRELDALVATHAMGWRRITEDPKGYWKGRSPTNVLSLLHEEVPRYSTDIAAAWEVVEHMRRKGYAVLLNYDYKYTEEWHAGYGVASDEFPDAVAVTAPLALCLAALKACGVEVDE